NKTATTKARLQKLQNVMSAFYSEYGTYPPVAYFGVPDPYVEQGDAFGDYQTPVPTSELKEANAKRAARCQPTEYLYPTPRIWNAGINQMYQDQQARNVNEAMAGTAASRPNSEWESDNGLRIFRFGLLSFLLPRFTMLGGNSDGNLTGDSSPEEAFIKSRQWRDNNPGSLREIYEREQLVISRWLPNFERFPLQGVGTVMGVQTGGGDQEYMHLTVVTDPQSGQKHVLLYARMYDGWGRDFYYHSAPPYQSYRIWSAGPDDKTFPPWATPRNAGDQKTVKGWIEDDIVLFDR
ncbi:MAG: hypothetical protein PHU80_12260, partial [Kiritimatiellae bacterium]|nr:hypothetical protein [Kiritimatiellia bacterium]